MTENTNAQATTFEGHIRRLYIAWSTQRDAALEGLAATHFQALVAIKERGPLPMREVARSLGATLGGATGFVDTAVREGLVAREPDPSDRRVVRVRLLPKGEQIVERVLGKLTAFSGSMLEKLSSADRPEAIRILSKLAESSD